MKRVLVVASDNQKTGDKIGKTFQDNFVIKVCNRSIDALSQVMVSHGACELVFTDYYLGDIITGLDLLKCVKKASKVVCTVLLVDSRVAIDEAGKITKEVDFVIS